MTALKAEEVHRLVLDALPGRPYRVALVSDRGGEKNRVEKLLEDAQIKLSVVASDIFGVSGREMMAALIGGERNPQVLAQMARSRMRTKIPQLEEAFVGYFTDHHGFLLTKMLARIDALDADIADLDTKIEAQIAPFADAVARLDQIPGIGATAAAVIIAEAGLDMTRFPTPAHLSSWARFAPGVKESAGRKIRRPQEGHRVHRSRRPLPGPGPGRSGRRREQDQHVPWRTLPAHRPQARQEEGRRGGRPLHPGHRLAPTIRSRNLLPRPGIRLLRLPGQPRT